MLGQLTTHTHNDAHNVKKAICTQNTHQGMIEFIIVKPKIKACDTAKKIPDICTECR